MHECMCALEFINKHTVDGVLFGSCVHVHGAVLQCVMQVILAPK